MTASSLRRIVAVALHALLAFQTLAAPANTATLLPPSEDPFYTIPYGIEYFPPGAIIRHRTPPAPIQFALRNYTVDKAHQILYRTADRLGVPTATVLTVLVPPNANFSRVISYQIAEDAAYVNCAASYAFLKGIDAGIANGTAVTQLEGLFIQTALEQGWVVILPDHEGPKASYVVNKAAAHATLDGIRAALQSRHLTRIPPNAAVALWGYSGGSIVSELATELQPKYAPEVKIIAAALGGLVPRIANTVAHANNSPAAGLLPAALKGLATQYSDVAAELARLLKPEFKAKFDKAETMCLGSLNVEYAGADLRTYFDTPDIFANKHIRRALDDNNLGQFPPNKTPFFMYKAVHDEISPTVDTDDFYDERCAMGASIEYARSEMGTHETEVLAGSLRAAAWLRDRLDGKPQTGCTKTTYSPTTMLDDAQVAFVPADLVATIRALLKIFMGAATGH